VALTLARWPLIRNARGARDVRDVRGTSETHDSHETPDLRESSDSHEASEGSDTSDTGTATSTTARLPRPTHSPGATTRTGKPQTAPPPTTPRIDRLLRTNPVLLLPGLQSPDSVAILIAAWNPQADPAGDGSPVADAVRWHGPIRLTPMLVADAGLARSGDAASCGLAYVAEVKRERTKVVDSRRADVVRRRYPRGVPVGAEAEAWQLVRGLAKRLRGVAQLPGCPSYAPHHDPEPLPGDHDQRVFSHEMLPWIVLREILRPLAPELSREALPGGVGYILRQRGLLEVRVRPADRSTAVPYAIRDRVDDAWPHSVYEFCDLTEQPPAQVPSRPAPPRAVANAAALIAEVTGGVLLDTDGFTVPIRATDPRWA
jgi:hypothetical protein